MCDLSNPIFHNEDKARKFLEKQRWADGVYCPFCEQTDTVKPYAMKSKSGKLVKGWHHCRSCRKKFTVRVGTLYERSHIPLHKWLMATHLMCSSKKGISALQLQRNLGLGSYKSAWFMAHRIREAMKPSEDEPPMGGDGKTIEADETFLGNKKANRFEDVYTNEKGWVKRGGSKEQFKIVSLVERDGRARSVHVPRLTANKVREVLVTNADRKSDLVTDEAPAYKGVGKEFASHQSVNHSKYEWGRGTVHTNTIEGFFGIFKRGMRGIYQHCGEQHLKRYLVEFDFRYSNRKATDLERTLAALKGFEGKRLTYRRIDAQAYA